MNQDGPTYSFDEFISRISRAGTEELDLLAEFATEEKYFYTLFHLKLIAEAFRLKRKLLKDDRTA